MGRYNLGIDASEGNLTSVIRMADLYIFGQSLDRRILFSNIDLERRYLSMAGTIRSGRGAKFLEHRVNGYKNLAFSGRLVVG